MSEQGLSFDGSLSTALAAALFKKLGIDSFLKDPACDRTESPYSVNKILQSGWSSGIDKLSGQFFIRFSTSQCLRYWIVCFLW